MPTSYYTERYMHEQGWGDITLRLVVSDTFAGLLEIPENMILTDILVGESTKTDSEVAIGVLALDDFDLQLLGAAIETTDDQNAYDFVLEATDPGVRRYVGLLVDPPDDIAPSANHFAFRGIVRPEFHGEDLYWQTITDWSADMQPVRNWKFSAGAYDVETLFSKKLETLLDGAFFDSTWKDANISDRLGYFRSPAGYDWYDHREARYADLMCLSVFLKRLMDAASDGEEVTLTWTDFATDLYGLPARMMPVRVQVDAGPPAASTRGFRYCWDLQEFPKWPRPWTMFADEWQPLICTSAFGYADEVGQILVSASLAWPWESDKDQSWRRYQTVGGFLYELAGSFACFVKTEYVSDTEIEITFAPRSAFPSSAVKIKDAVDSTIDVSPRAGNDDIKPWYGAATSKTREGDSALSFDGASYFASAVTSEGDDRIPDNIDARFLAVTCSPSWLFLIGTSNDAGMEPHEFLGGYALLPQSTVFWNETERQWGTNDPPQNQAALGLHTGMFIVVPPHTDDGCEYFPEYGGYVTPTAIVAPVGAVGAYMPNNVGSTDFKMYLRLSSLLNELLGLDAAHFLGERELTIPHLQLFRDGADAEGWSKLIAGGQLTLGSAVWTIVGIERQWLDMTTKITCHASSRFDLTGTGGSGVPAGGESGSNPTAPGGSGAGPVSATPRRKRYIASGGITRGNAVSLTDDKLVEKSAAVAAHYGRVIGIATTTVADGEWCDVVGSGVGVDLGDVGLLFTPGDRIYLRTDTGSGHNLSQRPLTGKRGGEDLYVDIGYAAAESYINIDIRETIRFK